MCALLAWLCSHPKCTIAVALVVVIFGAHRLLDWHTERQWQQYRAEASARGVKFTLEELVTPQIPDEENFAALPMWRTALSTPGGGARKLFEIPRPNRNTQSTDNPIKNTTIDWTAWQQAFRSGGLIAETTSDPVADVLRGLDSFGAQIAQWREWKNKPRTRFPFDPQQGIALRQPHNNEVQSAAYFFALRMRAHLEQGNSAAALEDFSDALQCYRTLAGEPLLISNLIRMSVLQLPLSRIGTGLAKQAWKGPELGALEASLAKLSIHHDVRFGFSTERVIANTLYEAMIRDPEKRATLLSGTGFPPGPPNGWQHVISSSISRRKLRKSQMRTNRDYDDLLAALQTQHPAQLVPVGSQQREEPSLFERWHFHPYHLMGSPRNSEYHFVRAARLENLIVHCRIAIALERYRLMHGSFPEQLDALVPTLLPMRMLDPWTGQPVIYSHVGNSFHLYSTGPDRTDDSGKINPKKPDTQQRDEIWLYAPP